MPKRSSKKHGDEDPNETAFRVVKEATRDEADQEDESPPKKNPAAVALGRLGGKKGGPARAKKLSAKRRKDIAKKAARARWSSKKTD